MAKDAVAIVNGVPITKLDLFMEVNRRLPKEFFHRNIGEDKQEELRKKALSSLVNEELVYQEAKHTAFPLDSGEVRNRLTMVQANYRNKKDYKAALKQLGLTEKEYSHRIEKEVLVEAFMRKHLTVSLSEEDLKEYYKKNEEKFVQPESLRARYIYVQVNPTEKEGKKKALELAMEALNKIKAGEDFAKVATEYSSDMSKVKGGDVGLMHMGMFPPELEKPAFALQAGEVSGILETDLGYHIFKVEEKNKPRKVAFEEIRDKLKKELTENLEKKKKEELFQRLKQAAKIEYSR